MASVTDLWPVVTGVAAGPTVFIALYKWVVKQLLEQIKLLTHQRNDADARADAQRARADKAQAEVDKEVDDRREAEHKAGLLAIENAGIKDQLDRLLASNASSDVNNRGTG